MRPTAPTARVPVGALVFAWGGAAVFAGSLLFFFYCYLIRFGRPAASGPRAAPIAIDILLFTGFALHHSVFARPTIKERVAARLPLPLGAIALPWIASARSWRSARRGATSRDSSISSPARRRLRLHLQASASGSRAELGAADVLDLAGVRRCWRARPVPSPPARRSAEREGGSPSPRARPARHHASTASSGIRCISPDGVCLAAPHMTLTRFTFAAAARVSRNAIPFENAH